MREEALPYEMPKISALILAGSSEGNGINNVKADKNEANEK